MKRLHRPHLFGWSVFNEDRNIDFHSTVWVRPEGNVVRNVGSDLHNSLMFEDNIKKELTIFLLKALFSLRNGNAIPAG